MCVQKDNHKKRVLENETSSELAVKKWGYIVHLLQIILFNGSVVLYEYV